MQPLKLTDQHELDEHGRPIDGEPLDPEALYMVCCRNVSGYIETGCLAACVINRDCSGQLTTVTWHTAPGTPLIDNPNFCVAVEEDY